MKKIIFFSSFLLIMICAYYVIYPSQKVYNFLFYNPSKLMLYEDTTGKMYYDYSHAKYVSAYIKEMGGKIVEEHRRYAGEIVWTVNSSTHMFKEKELKNLKKLELEILKNTILARHNYIFKNKKDKQFFEGLEWYKPLYKNVNNKLTDIEKANIKLLTRFEKYATDNYDSFGR